MEIEFEPAERVELTAFADKHQLKMRVFERTRTFYCGGGRFEDNRFGAGFVDTDVGENSVLIGVHGNGSTQERAMADYAARISGKKLVVNASSPERREIYTPELYFEPTHPQHSEGLSK